MQLLWHNLFVLFAIAFCDSTDRAAKVIDMLLKDKSTKDSLFGKVVKKQLNYYFTNEEPWGVNSLLTLHKYLSGVHFAAAISGNENYNEDARRTDRKNIKVFFAALLPPGMDSVLSNLCTAFCNQIMKEERTEDVLAMRNTYRYVHHNVASWEIYRLTLKGKPGKSIYELIRRFQKLYSVERLEDIFLTEKNYQIWNNESKQTIS